MAGEGDAFILILLAIIFPPAAVAFISGCGADLCLNILLTLLGYLPGFLHAVWLIMKRAEANEQYGYRNWTYTGMGKYNVVGAPATGKQPVPYGQPPPSVQPQPQPQPQPQGQYPAGYAQPPPPPQPQPPSDKHVYQAQAQPPADQKVDGNQKQSDQAPAPVQVPADQKAINVTPPPADQK